MTDMDEIRSAIIEAKKNGFDEAVFLGRREMTMLLYWAHFNGYITDPDTVPEDDSRPEIEGLPVYQVNANNYFRAA